MVRMRDAAVRVVGMGISLGLIPVLGAVGLAQTHKVEKPETVVRAVGVYEWTGDLTKPAASRLIPVSLYINGEFEDAAVYQPRPIPFALQPGNAYELQQAGVVKGLVELSSAGKLKSAESPYDDGWFGYGTFRPEAEVKAAQLKASRRVSAITTGKDDDTYGKGGGKDNDSAEKVDPDRPTLRRRSPGGKTEKKADPKTPDTTTAGTPAEDPDRPVLKKRGQKDVATDGADASAQKEIATGPLNNDPDRPMMHRGKPAGGQKTADGEAMAKMAGLPGDLHQMVAVSDAKNRAEHDFVRPWEDEAEHKAVMAEMEAMAAAKLAGVPVAAADASSGSTKTGTAEAKAAVPTIPAARRRAALAAAAAKRRAATAKAAGPGLLEEEDLRGYLLSYGGAPTFVYTAHTAGVGTGLRYVTVVAQKDVFGKLQTAFSSVTDAAHLDQTPWMRLVGVVDAEASNRASLLFEMREQGSRQFALYRVLGSRSEAVFTTGTTQ
jgi:hypothetical protein